MATADTPSPLPARPSVSIFAGSSLPKDPVIMEAATQLGRKLGEAGYDVVYGGGTQGVMGEVARAAQAAGAAVTALCLEKYSYEEQLAGATIVPVRDEQDRFDKLSTLGNPVAFFVLPGGPGALREALQGLEKAVYENGPPVILVQAGAYLDGIKQYFDLALAGGLIKGDKKDKLRLWAVDRDIAEAFAPPPCHSVAPDRRFGL
jgi:cytokinin riboside 5'-monophosphate phosphoribohydrolase